MASEDRRKRDLDLLMKSYKALEAEQTSVEEAPTPAERRRSADAAQEAAPKSSDEGEVMMYRGRPIRKGSGGIPGASSGQAKGSQFRGSSGTKKKSGNASADQLKAALKKLNELYDEGLISRADLETKRRQILDRL